MKKIALVVALILITSSAFAASASLFPDWDFRQGMDFLGGFSCTIGAIVCTTTLAFSLDILNDLTDFQSVAEFSGCLFLDAILITIAYAEYSKVFDRNSAFDYAMIRQHNEAWSTEIKIQGFTVGRIY